MLDDSADLALCVSHDTAITSGISEIYRQKPQLFGRDLLQQALESGHFNQRYVPVENQHSVCA
ncbi:hypothetical protein D3C76_1813760 [compost metagenome]